MLKTSMATIGGQALIYTFKKSGALSQSVYVISRRWGDRDFHFLYCTFLLDALNLKKTYITFLIVKKKSKTSKNIKKIFVSPK